MTDTHILQIVERFVFNAERHEGHEKWWLDWAVDSPAGASKHLTASWLALNAVLNVYDKSEIKTAYEAFGGVGAQALMINDLFDPMHHIGEWSDDAVAHLKGLFKDVPSTAAFKQDAYEAGYAGYDLVAFDCGDLTAWRTREGEKVHTTLDRLFSAQPKAVVITDIACRYLHLQRERYETLLGEGTCESYPSYLSAFLERIRTLWGYRLVTGYYDRWSAVMTLVPEDAYSLGGILHPTPNTPVGLVVL